MIALPEVIRPNFPCRTAWCTTWLAGSYLCWLTTIAVRSDRFSASRTRLAASRVMSSGFSMMTCLPASSAATAPSACSPLGVAIVTTSTSERSSTSSMEFAASAPCCVASSCARSGTTSATTANSALGCSDWMVWAWVRPITPAPITANRICAPSVELSVALCW